MTARLKERKLSSNSNFTGSVSVGVTPPECPRVSGCRVSAGDTGETLHIQLLLTPSGQEEKEEEEEGESMASMVVLPVDDPQHCSSVCAVSPPPTVSPLRRSECVCHVLASGQCPTSNPD